MKTTTDKIRIFKNLFSGLTNVYGTYDPVSGHVSQVKEPVSNSVIVNHLTGRRPYGVYLLFGSQTRAIAVDFDDQNRLVPMQFISSANHYSLSAHVERSKSKGYHVWIFFEEQGVNASKARLVICHILNEIEKRDTEVFPKHDTLNLKIKYGNFINAPLFGALVPKGKTVFIDPTTFKPYEDQWSFLESVAKIRESQLDDIIETNNLARMTSPPLQAKNHNRKEIDRFSLPFCARKMLENGVQQYQRICCFRLAIHLKRLGLPFDTVIAALNVWAQKNKPITGKGIISDQEISKQTFSAFKKNYCSYGCNTEAVLPFCDPKCPVNKNTYYYN